MALVLHDRVQESATANTTVSFTLAGAVLGFQTFAVVGNGNTTFYGAADSSGNWEVGLGTYSTTGPTLTRTTVYASSNSGSAVTFSGAVTVFVTYPSGRSVNLNESGNVSALGTVSSGVWQGTTVGVAYGGTGVTASSGPNSVVLRDADENIVVNSVTQELTKTVSSAGITTLTPASSHFQVLTGSTTHTYKLPDASTLPTGSIWVFDNDSTGNLTVTDNAGATVDVVAPGGYGTVFLEANGTVGGEWGRYGMVPAEVNWGTNSLDLGGSTVITNGVWQGTPVASGYGGTGLTTFTAANYALYSTSSSALTAGTLPIAAGGTGNTSGQAASVANALSAGTGLSYTTGTTFDGSAARTLNMANTAVTPGSYTYASITVDAQGRLTSASSGASPSAFPSGTAMMFVQTAAPTGWTKSTTHDNKALRVVSGTASSGGSVAFTTAFASQTPAGSVAVTVSAGTLAVGVGTLGTGSTTATGTVSTSTSVSLASGGSVSAYTLSVSEMPSHQHSNAYNSWGGVSGPGFYNPAYYPIAGNVNATGGSGSHAHGFTNPSYSGSSSSSFTGSAHSHTVSGAPSLSGAPSVTASSFTGTAINLAVQYVDVIIATKD